MNDSQAMHAMGIDDAYHVEQVLSRGPYGATELVTIDGIGPFVRKKIPLALAQRSVWASLNGAGSARIPHVEAMYELPDCLAIIVDYVPGMPLSQYLDSHGPFHVDEAIELTRHICEATSALHHIGILHRDLTPANIIVSDDGAHIIDFGIARSYTSPSHDDRDTTVLGTYGFAAPEQYGFARTDVRSDVYSIGRILGAMLTNISPDDRDYAPVLNTTLANQPRLYAVINRACSFEPSARYQSIDDLLRALDSNEDSDSGACTDVSTRSSTVDVEKKSSGPAQRHHPIRTIVIIAAIVIIMAMALTAGIPWLMQTVSQHASTDDNVNAQTWRSFDSTTDSNPTSDSVDSANNPLQLAESGWSESNGYVSYTFGLKNTSDSVRVAFPEIRITGYDEQDKIIFSDTITLAYSFAGQTSYFSGQTGNGVAPARVEFAVLNPQNYNMKDSSDAVTFTISDTQEVAANSDTVTFTGRIGVQQNDAELQGPSSLVNVTLVLRDANGTIVGGTSDYVDWPSSHETIPFSIETYGLPDYASYDIYAQVW